MDIEEKINIVKSIAAEIVTEEDLKVLFETKEHPSAYDGFEPSGLAHLPLGIYRPLILKELLKTGIKFKLLLADTHAWINNKMGGDIEKIRRSAEYYLEVWKVAGKALGVDLSSIEVIWHKDFFDDPEYWRKVLLIAKNHTITRTRRALTIAGRLDAGSNPTSFYFYPSLQCADIFHLQVDICQLGLDQRKVNVLAREMSEKIDPAYNKPLYKVLGYEGGVNGKPVLVHHSIIPGLEEPPKTSVGYDEDERIDKVIAYKMSKSKPETSIFVHDPPEVVRKKIRKAYCPPKSSVENPVLSYVKEIVFRAYKEFTVERKGKESLTFYNYHDLEASYIRGEIHPLDLKNALADYLIRLIEPIRKHFETNIHAKNLYETIKQAEITR